MSKDTDQLLEGATNFPAAAKLMGEAQAEVTSHWNFYKQLALIDYTADKR